MRAREFLFESTSTLTPRDLIKHGPERFNTLIDKIKDEEPLYKADGTGIIIAKSEAPRLVDLYSQNKFRGTINLLGKDGQTYSLGTFLKTKEFGGQAVPPGQDKELPANIKAGVTFQHGEPEKGTPLTANLALSLNAFYANQLGKKIINSTYLDKQGRVGQAVKQIAKEIEAGQLPTIPDLPNAELNNIQNYGFEYLGVQALIKGIADFPNADDFYNHIGTDLSKLVLYFPKSAGNPLADSYALTNQETENSIFISSKGAKAGAPSSVMGLKIPDNMRKMIKKDPPLEFLDYIQTSPKWKQPFNAANWLSTNYPGSMGPLEEFLPFDDKFLNYLEVNYKRPITELPKTIADIPEPYQKLYQFVQGCVDKKTNTPLFFDIRNCVKTWVHEAVKNGVIPNFNQRMLEILGENFILLKTERKGKPGTGHFITHVSWPAKIRGKVTFEHKDGPAKWDSAITWKLT